jgi:hypothetical protein
MSLKGGGGVRLLFQTTENIKEFFILSEIKIFGEKHLFKLMQKVQPIEKVFGQTGPPPLLSTKTIKTVIWTFISSNTKL